LPTDSLAILLGGMRPMSEGQDSMDSGALYDWNQIIREDKNSAELDLILAYLDLDASRYKVLPDAAFTPWIFRVVDRCFRGAHC
jgi:hypothetical protein